MTKMATVHARVSKATRDKLDRLAESMNRSKSYLAAEAIERFVDDNAWQVEKIEEAVVEADDGGLFYAHDDVMDYLDARARDESVKRPEPIKTK